MTHEYVAYKGSEFTIEWYHDNKGKSQALDYFESLDDGHKRKFLMLFQLMGDMGQIRNRKFRAISSDNIAYLVDRYLIYISGQEELGQV